MSLQSTPNSNLCYKLSCMCDCELEHKQCRIAGQHTQAELELLRSE
jgi:hypothetical protein